MQAMRVSAVMHGMHVTLVMRKHCKEGGEAADEYVTWEPYKGKEGGFIRRQAGAVYAAISS